jgi:O-acetyl-ADP-ribose deacetylase
MKILKEILVNQTILRAIEGDLTEAPVDAIVNAANSHLRHGGGVAGAIVRRGGNVIQEESDRIGFVPVGQCAITSAGSLKARYVIHAVGPQWGEGDEESKLRSAVRNMLKTAEERGFVTVAMPAISAGIFGFPKGPCAHIIVEEIVAFAMESAAIKEIDIYLADPRMRELFSLELDRIKGVS